MRTNREGKISKPLYAKSISEYNQKQRAGVVQWQNGSFPSFGPEFDSFLVLVSLCQTVPESNVFISFG